MKGLFYTNLFVATTAAVLSAGTFRLLGTEPELAFSVWVFFATLAVYALQRLMKLRTYTLSTEMMAWLTEHRFLLLVLVGVGLMGAAFMAMHLPMDLLFDSWPMVLICLLYAFPLVHIRGRKMALREWPHLKLFLIAVVWSFITLWMPMKLVGLDIDTWAISLLIERALFIMAITIPFDIRDKHLDPSSMRTLPQVLGSGMATVVSMSLLIIGLLIYGFGLNRGFISLDTMMWTSMVYALAMVLVFVGKRPQAYWYYLGLLDGLMLLLGAVWLFT